MNRLLGWLLVLTMASPVAIHAQDGLLKYEIDPDFFELPEGWNLGPTPGVVETDEGHILLFTRGSHQLLEFDDQGRFARELAPGQFEVPHGLRLDADGNIWTTDVGNHLVMKLDRDGRKQMVLGVRGQAGIVLDTLGLFAHRFNMPTDVAFDSGGNIYVADGYGNSRVVKFDPHGEFNKAWGEKGTAPGEFDLPHTIWIDASDRVWVGDRNNSRIQLFDTDGNLLDVWNEVGTPWGLAEASDGNAWMADGTANRIVKLDMNGNVLGYFGEGGRAEGRIGWAHYLTELQDGSIVVAEIVSHRAQRFVAPE
jgi:DNA-binding beta-propeller fold protein YncE